jgi:hypothetical protein
MNTKTGLRANKFGKVCRIMIKATIGGDMVRVGSMTSIWRGDRRVSRAVDDIEPVSIKAKPS